jgi:hypothetical protein
MSNIKPSDHGIVVENKVSGLRYASLDENYDPKSERKVRDLRVGESIFSYGVKAARANFAETEDTSTDEDDDTSLNTEDTPDTLDTVAGNK